MALPEAILTWKRQLSIDAFGTSYGSVGMKLLNSLYWSRQQLPWPLDQMQLLNRLDSYANSPELLLCNDSGQFD
jgi:hypothetical protein